MTRECEPYLLQEAIASRPRKPLTHNQTRRLETLDIEVNRLIGNMDRDIKYRIDHKAWEARQFDKDHLGK